VLINPRTRTIADDYPWNNAKEVFRALVADEPENVTKNKDDENLDAIFCSELVAEAYQRAGVLPENKLNSNEVLPSMFAHGGAIDRIMARDGGSVSLGGKERLLFAPASEMSEWILHQRARRLGKDSYTAGQNTTMVAA
jgi:hypothetical protein